MLQKDDELGNGMGMTLDTARMVLAAAREKAQEIRIPMNIAVVDEGNNLTAFARTDGAWLEALDIAQIKANTARAFEMDTHALGSVSQPNQFEPIIVLAKADGF